MPYIIAIIIVAVIGVGFTLFQTSRTPEVTAPEAITGQLPDADNSAATLDYKDGTYKTTTTYRTPKQDEYQLEVTLLLVGDIVTDSQIVYSQGAEKDPNAQRFEAAYRAEIIGKDLDSLNLARVGGASLTTGGFNKALETIKTDAKS